MQIVNRPDAVGIRNEGWSPADVRNHYSYRNAHSDLYRYLSQWSDLDIYLNVGYSEAGQYALSTKAHLRLLERLANGLLALHRASIHSRDRRLLDVASGRGGPAIFMRRKYGLDVVGIDLTAFNVSRAERNSREQKVWPNVRFVIGDALELPLTDSSFSMAWSIESPAHFPDKPAFLREAGRVLKPRGVFAFADLLIVEPIATASRKNRGIYDEFLRVWDVPYLESHESYRHSIANAGFELVRTEIVTRNNLTILERWCRMFLLVFRVPPLYRAYRRYIKALTGADLENVYEHVLKSYRALHLRMIDYALFWAVRV